MRTCEIKDINGKTHTIDFDNMGKHFINVDCMEALRQMPDNAVDICICDPPYGIKRLERPNGRLEKYGDSRKANNEVPNKEYFNELFRVSKHQIIWGGQLF